MFMIYRNNWILNVLRILQRKKTEYDKIGKIDIRILFYWMKKKEIKYYLLKLQLKIQKGY
jgi:hypothetical protein